MHSVRTTPGLPIARIKLLGFGILFNALLWFYYAGSIVSRHEYTGITIREVPGVYWLAAWCLSLLPLTWLPIRFRLPSDFGVWILYVTVIAPGPLVALMVSYRHPFDVLYFQFVIVASFALIEFRRVGQSRRRMPILGADFHGNSALPLLVVALTLLVLSFHGFVINVSFTDVYARRLESLEVIRGGSILGYVNALLMKTLVPLSIAVGVAYKNRWYLGAGLFASIVGFGIDGTKIAMIQPFLIVGVVLLARRPAAKLGPILLIASSVIVMFAWLEETMLETYVLNDFAVRRIFVVPSLLSTFYWEYFSEHSHVYMLDGLIGKLLGNQHDISVGHVIGWEYLNSEDANANAGIWATAFAHFGYAALPVVGGIVAWLLRLTDRLASGRCFVIGAVVAFTMGVIWSEKALHTSLLTGGILPMLFVFYFFPRAGNALKAKRALITHRELAVAR